MNGLNFDNNSSRSNLGSDDDFNLGRIVRMILMQSKLIIFIIFLGAAIGVLSYMTTEKQYKVKSLLQVFNNNPGYGNQNLDYALGFNATGNTQLDNIASLYTSRSNMLQVITQNKLYIVGKGFERGLFKVFEKSDSSMDGSKKFKIEFYDDYYSLTHNDIRILDRLEYKELYNLAGYYFEIEKKPQQNILEFTLIDPDKVYRKVKSLFSIRTLNDIRYGIRNTTGLIEISYLTNNIDEGINILNYANNLYINNNIESESETARKALTFIDENISKIEVELESDKTNLKVFKESNKSIDVDLEVKSILDNIAFIDAKINEIDLEIAKASNLYTASNPIYLDFIQQREELLLQKRSIEEKIKNLPMAQQEYVDLFKALEMSEQVYSELLNRRLELSIKEASTLGNIRVIDSAYLDSKVSPKLSSVIYTTFIFGLIALITSIIRGFYFIPITNPAEIQDNGIDIPIVGVVSRNAEEDQTEDSVKRPYESLYVNIKSKLDPKGKDICKTILFTSASSENGKSYNSRMFAKTVASLGYKVALLDGDYIRGDQHKNFSNKKVLKKDFGEIRDETIEKYKIDEKLYLIPRISRLDNSFQFVYSHEFQQTISYLKSEFDYLVIDTPPMLSVTDASILMSFSDINLIVAMHEKNKINELKQLIAVAAQIGIEFDGLVYNAYERPSGYYGYYDLYGNYAYQYYAKKYLYENYEYKSDS